MQALARFTCGHGERWSYAVVCTGCSIRGGAVAIVHTRHIMPHIEGASRAAVPPPPRGFGPPPPPPPPSPPPPSPPPRPFRESLECLGSVSEGPRRGLRRASEVSRKACHAPWRRACDGEGVRAVGRHERLRVPLPSVLRCAEVCAEIEPRGCALSSASLSSRCLERETNQTLRGRRGMCAPALHDLGVRGLQTG